MAHWALMGPLSLVDHGLDTSDDEDLRRYLSLTEAPPASSPFLARWHFLERVFDWDHRGLKYALASFYASGFLPYAFESKFMEGEHEKLFPVERRPVGGAALVDWEARQRARPSLIEWVRQLYAREARGESSGPERLLLERVGLEASIPLGRLVQTYKGRRDFVLREDARAARERAIARIGEGAKTRPPPTRRRQDLVMPEVVRRRPR